MKVFNALAVAVFLGAVGFITYSLIKDSDKKYYTTTYAETADVQDILHLSGFVYPSKEIEVKPQISGVIDAVYVNIGDIVNEGDPIVSISLVPNSSEVEQLRSNVNLASINLSTAKVSYERQKLLLEKKAISKVDFEASEKEFLTAKENYSTALKQLNLRQKGKEPSNNIVRSSTSGIIIDISVKVGASVVERSNFTAGSTIATIAGADYYIFRADALEKNVGSLYLGMPVKLSLLAFDGKEADAVITKISSKGEMNGGAVKFPIEAVFSMADDAEKLRSGYSAIGEIVISTVKDALTLPEKCINFKGDTTYVYVTDSLKNRAMERIVTVGLSDGEKVQIMDGITPKDLVITNYHD